MSTKYAESVIKYTPTTRREPIGWNTGCAYVKGCQEGEAEISNLPDFF